jgi:hypothetical protein
MLGSAARSRRHRPDHDARPRAHRVAARSARAPTSISRIGSRPEKSCSITS